MVLRLAYCTFQSNGVVRSLCKLGMILCATSHFLTAVLNRLIVYSRGTASGKLDGLGMPALAIAHAALFVVPAVAITLPKPSKDLFGDGLVVGLTNIVNCCIAPLSVLVQFCAQYIEIRRQNGQPGALSLLSACLQALVMALIATRLFMRMGRRPHYDRGDMVIMPWNMYLWDLVSIWYSWGMLAFNYVAVAIGWAVLLCCYYLSEESRGARRQGKTTHFLA